MLFHDFLNDPAEDGNEPEEWICSAVRAIRLPVQVHPTREFSRRNFGSPYGKAESWLILATRPDACIYFGFRERITKEALAAVVERSEQEPEAMTQLVNRVPVKAGDIFFVNAGVIHAIGAGCLILEVQEPTDFTIQPEHWCGEYHLNDQEMYLGLDKDTALDCFRFDLYGESAVEQGRKKPAIFYENGGLKVETLIGDADTPCFSMRRYLLEKGSFTLDQPASVWVCAAGEGCVEADGERRELLMGDYFFLPAAAAGKCTVSSEHGLTLVCCMGGE